MEKNKKIIKLCYLQIAFYVVFLTSLFLHFKRGLDHRAFALLIILAQPSSVRIIRSAKAR